jgi:LacI family transcriptional regulator
MPGTRSGRTGGRPTMKDIADRVGVSTKSVSRVVNSEPGTSPQTTERILAVARELGFRRNDLARSLARGDRTGTIGLVLKHSSTRFYDNLIRGIVTVADAYGSLVLTAGSQTAERERATLLALSSLRVDGMLIVPIGPDHAYLEPEQASGIPLVFVDRPPRGIEADTILSDDFEGGRSATRHLLARGHRRIAAIGAAPDLHTVSNRTAGYDAALSAAGIGRDPGLVRLGVGTPHDAPAAVVDLMTSDDPPTALFALNNVCAIGAVRALKHLDMRHRVAVVGFDDFDTADLLDPPLTVVAHDIVELGRRAAERLFARVAGAAGPPVRDVLPTTLIPRGSGEMPPP